MAYGASQQSQTGHNSALASQVLSPFGPCKALEVPGPGSLESCDTNPMFPVLVPHPSSHRPPEHGSSPMGSLGRGVGAGSCCAHPGLGLLSSPPKWVSSRNTCWFTENGGATETISHSEFSNCLVVSKFLFLHQWDFFGEKLVLLAVGAQLVSLKRDPAEPATGRGGGLSSKLSSPCETGFAKRRLLS